MAEVQLKLSALKACELSTMLGRSLMSKYKADFFLTFTRSHTYLYTYDEAVHEVRLLFQLETHFFEDYRVTRTATIKIEAVKDLFLIIEKNCYKVETPDQTQAVWIKLGLDEAFVEEQARDGELKILNVYECFEVVQMYFPLTSASPSSRSSSRCRSTRSSTRRSSRTKYCSSGA